MEKKEYERQKDRQRAVEYLNRLNTTQWEKITEYLQSKLNKNGKHNTRKHTL